MKKTLFCTSLMIVLMAFITYCGTTKQVQSAPDPKHIVIVVSGLEVPKPIVNGSGFRPKVDDWQTKEIEVGMYNRKRN